jgi:hypothetical protein
MGDDIQGLARDRTAQNMRLLEHLPKEVREEIAQARAPAHPASFWVRFILLVVFYLLLLTGPVVIRMWMRLLTP